MSSYGVFNLISGELVVAMQATDISQVQIQAPRGSDRVVLEGDFSRGKWTLGEDGWPVEDTTPAPISIAQVKYVARKRIEATEWKLRRHEAELRLDMPTSITEAEYLAILMEHSQIRVASNAIEQMDPIPADFWQDHYWTQS